MNADDRILLLDLENLGTVRLRPRPLRTRLETLLAAAGEIHHAVAAYALPDASEGDPLASQLAGLRIAPLRVPPGPDAAELALLAHARHVQSRVEAADRPGGRRRAELLANARRERDCRLTAGEDTAWLDRVLRELEPLAEQTHDLTSSRPSARPWSSGARRSASSPEDDRHGRSCQLGHATEPVSVAAGRRTSGSTGPRLAPFSASPTGVILRRRRSCFRGQS